MDEREKQVIESMRAEALALFTVNQQGRRAADRTVGLVLTSAGVSAAVGINAGTPAVLLPLAPVVLLLLSHMFQQFVEVTVTGAGRALLEREIADRLDGPALIYEAALAPIRKQAPLKRGVRLLQGLSALLAVALTAAAFIVALDGQHWYVLVGFLTATALALLSAAVSFHDMLASGAVADRALDEWLAGL